MTVERYKTPEIEAIWNREGELARLNRAAVAAATVSGPPELLVAVQAAIRNRAATVNVWRTLEMRYDHDIAAYVEMIRRLLPAREAQLWHRGRTSSDLVETALGIGLRESDREIWFEVDRLTRSLARRAVEHRDTPVIGRTHGQAAEPTTVGRRFAVIAYALDQWSVGSSPTGKLSGPVGVDVHPDEEGLLAAMSLGSTPSTQIVPRWHLAAWVAGLLPLSVKLSTLATTIRLGSQTDIAWCRERSASLEARGSSAMPHKRNPIRSERAVGLCKLIRHNIYAVIDAGAELWDERDISHSSVERAALVDAIQLVHFVVRDLTGVVDRLEVDEEAASRRTDRPTGLGAVEALVAAGETYQSAYDKVREYGPARICEIAGVDGRGKPYDPDVESGLWKRMEFLAR